MAHVATPNDPGATFIAACLAPLPAGSCPAARRQLEREAKEALRDRWWRAWAEVKLFEHATETAHFARLLASDEGLATTISEHPWREKLRAAVERMILVPVPRKSELAFKRKYLWCVQDKAAAERVISADEARLARRATGPAF